MKLEKLNFTLVDGKLEIFTPILSLFRKKNKFLSNSIPISFEYFQKNFLEKITGQFLILATLDNKTSIAISDRWGSIPIFYNYRLKRFSQEPDFEGDVSEISLFSLYYTRRLFSSSSLYKSSKRINAGHIAVKTSKNELKVHQWNRRQFSQKVARWVSPQTVATQLQSLAKGYDGCGLFISGGLDTRSILAAGEASWIQGTTLAFSKHSRELQVASKLCALNDTSHKVQTLNIDEWRNNISTAIYHSKFGYPINSLFLVMPELQMPHVTGIGLDYMFQGMYLNPQMNNMTASVDNVLRTLPCGNRYIARNTNLHQSEIYSHLVNTIENNKLNSGELNGDNFIDLFRNIVFADPSMHYSFTDYLSQSERVPTSVIAFDPVLDDLWQKIDFRQLFDKEFMLQTLSHINRDFLRIISANNNLPLRYTNFDRLKLYLRNGIRRIVSQRNLEHEVRTWPTQGYMARELLSLYSEEFFVKKAAVFDFSWMRSITFMNELEWFRKRKREFRFGRVHCDRENNLFYMLNILLVAD